MYNTIAFMINSISKIYRGTSLIILAIIISGLLNVCIFSLQAKAAPMPMPKVNFAYSNGDSCVAEPMPMPTENLNYPAAPMPECCLQQNRSYNALVNTANDRTAPTYSAPIILSSDNLIAENNFSYNTSQIVFPPPEALSLASTVMRE